MLCLPVSKILELSSHGTETVEKCRSIPQLKHSQTGKVIIILSKTIVILNELPSRLRVSSVYSLNVIFLRRLHPLSDIIVLYDSYLTHWRS